MKKIDANIMRLLLCCCLSPVIAGTQGVLLTQPFDAAGDFVFQTFSTDQEAICTLAPGATFALIIRACRDVASDCTDDVHWVQTQTNQGTSIQLQANSTYHFSPMAIKSLSNRYHTATGIYPNRMQIAQMYCLESGTATVSNDGMYTASCSDSGCTGGALSGSIVVTF